MMRLHGTGVDARLFGHMIVQDEEPLFPQSPATETDLVAAEDDIVEDEEPLFLQSPVTETDPANPVDDKDLRLR